MVFFVFFVALGVSPVLFCFRGTSSIASWPSCLVFCFSPVLVISALYILLCVCSASAISFLSVLLSTVTLCGCLLPFLALLVSSASPCRCFGCGPHSPIWCCFIGFLPFFCDVHSFALCVCVVRSVPLFGVDLYSSLDFGVSVLRFSPGVICVFFLALLCGVLVSAVLLPRSDLRFLLRCGLPLGRGRV